MEINWNHALKKEDALLLDNHSFLNLLNVLEQQLSKACEQVSYEAFSGYRDLCLDILMDLSSREFTEKLPVIESRFNELRAVTHEYLEKEPDHKNLLKAILEILAVALVRTSEFRTDRFQWKYIPCEAFLSNLIQFLGATEKVSQGKFHFVYTPTKAEENDYEIDFRIESRNSELFAPTILHDTIRDIVGNSRKYSPAGTLIKIRLKELPGKGLRVRISDEGIGIPESEIRKVVEFGYRATNALDRKTMGGGFGLTKAYLLSKRFGGEFHIASRINEGTTVEFTLLRPT